jgi:hypothetical protein
VSLVSLNFHSETETVTEETKAMKQVEASTTKAVRDSVFSGTYIKPPLYFTVPKFISKKAM